eukprot:1159753-Pelagomonas_calceolata.AAC.3
MVLVLLLGDMHIPHRAADLPPQFKELLKPGKIHSILCAGNLCSKTLMEYLKSITPDVTLVQGAHGLYGQTRADDPLLKVANRFVLCNWVQDVHSQRKK